MRQSRSKFRNTVLLTALCHNQVFRWLTNIVARVLSWCAARRVAPIAGGAAATAATGAAGDAAASEPGDDRDEALPSSPGRLMSGLRLTSPVPWPLEPPVSLCLDCDAHHLLFTFPVAPAALADMALRRTAPQVRRRGSSVAVPTLVGRHLVELPERYDQLATDLNEKFVATYGAVPDEPALCLVTGAHHTYIQQPVDG